MIRWKIAFWKMAEAILLLAAGTMIGARMFGHAGVWTVAIFAPCLLGWGVLVRLEPWWMFWWKSEREGFLLK